MTLEAIKWKNGRLEILDQLLLPAQSKYIEVTSVEDGWNAIYKMQVCFVFDCFIVALFRSIHLNNLIGREKEGMG